MYSSSLDDIFFSVSNQTLKSWVTAWSNNKDDEHTLHSLTSMIASMLIPSVQIVTLGKGVSFTGLFVSWMEIYIITHWTKT